MIVQVKGKRYQLGFSHREYSGTGRYTSCYIKDLGVDEPVVVAEGFAECSPEDQFCKETGRKIALTRALGELFPEEKETRRLFWKYYRGRSGKTPDPNGNKTV